MRHLLTKDSEETLSQGLQRPGQEDQQKILRRHGKSRKISAGDPVNDFSENKRRKQRNGNRSRHRQNDPDGKPFFPRDRFSDDRCRTDILLSTHCFFLLSPPFSFSSDDDLLFFRISPDALFSAPHSFFCISSASFADSFSAACA